MVERKPFALRLTPDVMLALQRLADDELRSVNGQIEVILREALIKRGYLRFKKPDPVDESPGP